MFAAMVGGRRKFRILKALKWLFRHISWIIFFLLQRQICCKIGEKYINHSKCYCCRVGLKTQSHICIDANATGESNQQYQI